MKSILRIFALLFTVSVFSSTIYAQNVSVPDADLAAALRTALSLEADAEITQAKMNELTRFEVGSHAVGTDSGIVDLTGLEAATNLTTLTIIDGNVTNLAPISELTSLTSLTLHGHGITDISSLSKLTKLTYLDLEDNGISDMTTLSKLKNLTHLLFRRNVHSAETEADGLDISALSGLTDLTHLDLGLNKLFNISALSGLTNLETLELLENRIYDLTPLSNLSALRTLDVSTNDPQHLDISSLSNLTGLTYLDISNNDAVRDVGPLSGLTNLGTLVVDASDLTPFARLPLLQLSLNNGTRVIEEVGGSPAVLDTAVNIPDATVDSAIRTALNITQPRVSLKASNLLGLTTLSIAGQRGSTVVQDLTGLEWAINLTALAITAPAGVSTHSLNNIRVLGNSQNLESLTIQGSQVADIPTLAVLTGLSNLDLTGNRIRDITVLSELTGLTQLWLANNSISDVSSLSGLTGLTDLRLAGNRIQDVSDLSGLVNLQNLTLQNNPSVGGKILDTRVLYTLETTHGVNVDIDVSQYPAWDVNRDGVTNATDVSLVTDALGRSDELLDVNGDGVVNATDVALVTAQLPPDTVAPTVSITAPSTPQNGAFDATITFSEVVSDFVQADVTLGGTATASITSWGVYVGNNTVENTAFTATITPTTEGSVTINVAASVATDAAGNANTAATAQTVTIDTTVPTVSVTAPSTPQNGAFDATITFSEAVSDFVQADVTLGGTATATITGWTAAADNTTFTATITPTTRDSVTISVAASVATDAAGNANTAATAQTVTIDMRAPTVSVTAPSTPQNSAFDATITFSEAVSDFVQADVTLGGTATASVTGWTAAADNTTFTATITPTTSGSVTISVAASVATDTAGNANTAATAQTVSIDMDGPTVSVTAPSGPQALAFDATLTFNEAVSDFVQADVTLGGTATASITNWTAAADNTTFTATITPSAEGDLTINVAASVATDTAGNANTAATELTIPIGLSVTLSVPDTPQQRTFRATATFSEVVDGSFAVPKDGTTYDNIVERTLQFISIEGSTVDMEYMSLSVTGDPKVHIFEVRPTSSGTVKLTIPAGVARTAAGILNSASQTHTVEVDNDAPTVSIDAPSENVKQVGAFDATFTFSEAVSNFVQGDVTLGGTATASITDWTAADDTTFTATITPTTSGTVIISVDAEVATDAAENPNTASTEHTVTIDLDTTAPTVSIGAPSGPQTADFDVTFTFSETVSDFVQDDVTVGGTATASITSWTAAADGLTYTATIAPTTDGDVTISVAAGVATDAASNENTAATEATVSVDMTAPTIIIAAPVSRQEGAFDVRFTFSEAVSDFVQDDVTLEGTAEASITSWTAVDGDMVYVATVTPTTTGDVTINVDADVATDAAGNGNTASDLKEVDVNLDFSAELHYDPSGEESNTFVIHVTFSETVSDFTAEGVSFEGSAVRAQVTDVTVANEGTGTTASTDNTIYAVTVKVESAGTVTLHVIEGAASNSDSEDNLASEPYDVEVRNFIVSLPDVNVAAYINATLGYPLASPIHANRMLLLEQLTVEGSVESLVGLEAAPNLTKLSISGESNNNRMPLTDLTPLSSLTRLTSLTIRRGEVIDLTPLSDLANLESLVLNANRISDLTPLSDLSQLSLLRLNNNKIEDLAPLSGLINLTTLGAPANSISDVSPLSGLRALKTLALKNNSILDTSPLYPLLYPENEDGRLEEVDITITEHPPWDVNEDGTVGEADSALVAAALGQSGGDIVDPRTDVNGDGTVDNEDLLLVTDNLDADNAAPGLQVAVSLDVVALENVDRDVLEAQLQLLRLQSDGSAMYLDAIAMIEAVLLATRPPMETLLLANYPNPFNPETWIPYHLAHASDVVITLYDVRGTVVRRLALGHQREGYYTNRSRAAYWDGRNAVGERVASGIYFYQLEADGLSLLRKMVILK